MKRNIAHTNVQHNWRRHKVHQLTGSEGQCYLLIIAIKMHHCNWSSSNVNVNAIRKYHECRFSVKFSTFVSFMSENEPRDQSKMFPIAADNIEVCIMQTSNANYV